MQVEPMVSRETRPQHQVKKSSHCISWKYGTSFILGICSLFLYFVGTIFSSLPVPIWYTPGWREAKHNDLSKSWTQTHQTGGHLANHWTTASPTKKRGWELDSLWSKTQLRVIMYHSYLFLLLPTSIGREWIIGSTKWGNKHGQVRLLY